MGYWHSTVLVKKNNISVLVIVRVKPFIFQRLSKTENSRYWYSNVPLGHNYIGDMMPAISTKAGPFQFYTNLSMRATIEHIVDGNEFSGCQITSIFGQKSDLLLKTHTQVILLQTLNEKCQKPFQTLRPVKQSKTNIETDKENYINLINSDSVSLSISQYDTLVSDVFSKNPDIVDISRTIDTVQLPTKHTSNNTNISVNVNTNFHIPVLHTTSNITINFNH